MAAAGFKGGELVFCGNANWSCVGRSSHSSKWDGIDSKDMELLEFHRIKSMLNIRISFCFSGPVATHCFACATDGRLFAFGRNEHGELGLGHLTNVYSPTLVTSLEDEKIIHGACGGSHSLIISERGDIYSSGDGSSGQLGLGKIIDYQKNFAKINVGGQKATRCSAGREFSMIVTDSGELYACGHPLYGQLGNGTEGKFLERAGKETYTFEKSPLKVEFPLPGKIKDVACGANHTIAMDSEGKLYSWGFGGYGRLGHKDNKDQHTPKAIDVFHEQEKPIDPNLPSFMQRRVPPTRATMIGCGNTASFATLGEPYFSLYMWGLTKKTGEAKMYPQLVDQVSGWKVKSFTCGNTSTMVSCPNERKVISWGPSPTYGELGYGASALNKSSTVSQEVKSLTEAKVPLVAMGYSHSMAIIDIDDPKGPKVVEKLPVFDPQVTPKENKPEPKKRKTPAAKTKRKSKKNKDENEDVTPENDDNETANNDEE